MKTRRPHSRASRSGEQTSPETSDVDVGEDSFHAFAESAGNQAVAGAVPPVGDPADADAFPFQRALEAAFGEDFSDVDVSVDPARAGDVGANAFAGDDELVLGSASPTKELVAHELAHVVQRRQRGGGERKALSERSDPAEAEAERAGAAAAAGRPVGELREAPEAVLQRDAAEGDVGEALIAELNGMDAAIWSDSDGVFDRLERLSMDELLWLASEGNRSRLDAQLVDTLGTNDDLYKARRILATTLAPIVEEGTGADTVNPERVAAAWFRVEHHDGTWIPGTTADAGPAMHAIADLTAAERRALYEEHVSGHSFSSYGADAVATFERMCTDPTLDQAAILRIALEEGSSDALGMEQTQGHVAGLMTDLRASAAEEGLSDEEARGRQEALASAESTLHDRALLRELTEATGSTAVVQGLRVEPLELGVQELLAAADGAAVLRAIEDVPGGLREQVLADAEVAAHLESLSLGTEESKVLAAHVRLGTAESEGGDEELPDSVIDDLLTVADDDIARAWDEGSKVRVIRAVESVPVADRRRLKELPGYKGIDEPGFRTQVDQVIGGTVLGPGTYMTLALTDSNASTRLETVSETLSLGANADIDRPAYVAWVKQQRDGDAALTEEERELAKQYGGVHGLLTRGRRQQGMGFDPSSVELANDVLLGVPTFDDGSAEVDYATEAELMAARLQHQVSRDRSGLTDWYDWSGSHVDRDYAAFMESYEALSESGRWEATSYNRLVGLYHRASASLGEHREDTSAVASIAATVGAVVAATVVTAVTGGAGAPFAITLAASVTSGGVAAAAAGHAVRGGTTDDQLAKDFATGAVEGALTASGTTLAAKAVQGLAVGARTASAIGRVGASKALQRAGATAMTVAAEGAIDGAIGGMGGEVFATALDEALWDRTIGQIFGEFILAAGRGAFLGALAGSVGGVGGHAIARTAGIARRGLGEVLSRSAAHPQEAAFRDALHAALPAHIADEMSASTGIRVLEVEDEVDAFFDATRSRTGQAAIVPSEDGGWTVLVRAGADPSVMDEEAVHLMQAYFNSPSAKKMANLYDAAPTPEAWRALEPERQRELYLDKLDVEIEAQEIQLRKAERGPGNEQAIARAEHDLAQLVARRHEARAVQASDLESLPWWDADQPAWLMQKQSFVDGEKTPRWDNDAAPRVRAPGTSTAAKRGEVWMVGEPWVEGVHLKADLEGTVRIEAADKGGTLIIVEGAAETRQYLVNSGGQVAVEAGEQVRAGAHLATEAREYRLVEVRNDAGDVIETRGEIKRLEDGVWQQRGSESTARGAHAEKVANEAIEVSLGARKAAGEITNYIKVNPRNGSGGFDGAYVEFIGEGAQMKAVIRYIEVKDYPGRWVPFEDFSAITTNLGNNVRVMAERLRRLAASLPSDQRLALEDAIEDLDFQVELHLTEGTRVGRRGETSARTRLEAHLKEHFESATLVESASPVDVSRYRPATGVADE